MKTNQEVFDISVRHVITQAYPSAIFLNGVVANRYRGPENRQCGAGPFIRDYSPEMEGLSFWSVLARPGNACPLYADIGHTHHFLISRLQQAHDYAALWCYRSLHRTFDVETFLKHYISRISVISIEQRLSLPFM